MERIVIKEGEEFIIDGKVFYWKYNDIHKKGVTLHSKPIIEDIKITTKHENT